jgi:hypothetical protein
MRKRFTAFLLVAALPRYANLRQKVSSSFAANDLFSDP